MGKGRKGAGPSATIQNCVFKVETRLELLDGSSEVATRLLRAIEEQAVAVRQNGELLAQVARSVVLVAPQTPVITISDDGARVTDRAEEF